MASNALRFLDLPSNSECTCDILDKSQGIFDYASYMFNRTSQMFEYDGMPDSIPFYLFEFYLQWFGGIAIIKHESELYAIPGQPGGPPDPYHRGTTIALANPALGIGQTYRIANHLPPFDKSSWTELKPAVWIRNDTRQRGLRPINFRYATQLTENDVSIRSAQINSRQQSMICAQTDSEAESAKQYIDGLEAGKMEFVSSAPFLEGIKAMNVSTMSSNSILQLIELQQYLKASWFNEIGLNANFNMKREYLSAEEIQASTDILLPLSDDMLMCREVGLKAVEDVFGVKISVKKNSSWENKEDEIKAAQIEMSDEVQSTEQEEKEDEKNE